MFKKPISISLSPNTKKDDVFLALKIIFQPWRWKGFDVTEELQEKFKQYLGIKYAFAFNSGRSALMAILNVLNLKEADFTFAKASADKEILIQAFTCNAVPNPILWSGFKPVYVDIDESLNIDAEDLEKKITSKSKAIIVQHTFGIPPKQMAKILTLAECYNLKIIEDCAHGLGMEINGKKVGTIGDMSFFSFGRDKIISSVYGGMVVTNNQELAKKISEFQEKCEYPSKFWIFQQLLHPIVFSIALPTYYFLNFGKFLIWFCQKLRLLSKAVTKKEKNGENPGYFPQKMPNALALLVLNQLKKVDKFNEHRRKIAKFYKENLSIILCLFQHNSAIYWKYPIFAKNPDKIRKEAKKYHILLDDGWWGSPIMPPGTNLEKFYYKIGDCQKAERAASHILNLPTHINISKKQAEKILDLLKGYKDEL